MNKYYVPQFQFHKGTIRTIRFGNLHQPHSTFQFHKGTIRTKQLLNALGYGEISIP